LTNHQGRMMNLIRVNDSGNRMSFSAYGIKSTLSHLLLFRYPRMLLSEIQYQQRLGFLLKACENNVESKVVFIS